MIHPVRRVARPIGAFALTAARRFWPRMTQTLKLLRSELRAWMIRLGSTRKWMCGRQTRIHGTTWILRCKNLKSILRNHKVSLRQGTIMKSGMLVTLLAISACGLVLAQTPAENEVLQFERDACKAFLDANPAALERVLTADFTLTLSNGDVSTRADEINDLRSGKVHYDTFENYDMLARVYGDSMAVVLGKTRVKGTAEGKPFDHTVQFTDTLIKRDGRWQLAAGHVSRLEK